MITPQLQKLIVIFITMIFLSYVGYTLYNVNPDLNFISSISTSETDSQDILATVAKLKELEIDPSVFKSDIFLSLKDVSPVIVTEEVGRVNPFALIGSEIIPLQSTKVVSSVKKTGSN